MRKLFVLCTWLFLAASADAQTLIAHGCANFPNSTGGTYTINTTGANFIAIFATSYGGVPTVTDNQSNSISDLGVSPAAAIEYLKFFYIQAPTVAASHIFSFSGGYGNICILAYSGMETTGVYQTSSVLSLSDTSGTATTINTGVMAPSSFKALVITVESDGGNAGTVKSIDAGFSIGDQLPYAVSQNGIATAYKTLTVGSTNPTWTLDRAPSGMAMITAAFKVAAPTVLSAGSISLVSNTNTQAVFSATDATAGTAPYTYQWYRSTVNGFTPGSGSLLSGKTSLSLTDTGLTAGGTYYYVIGYADAAAGSAFSGQYTLNLPLDPPTAIGFIGDSTTVGFGAGTSPAIQMQLLLSKYPHYNTTYSISNQALTSTSTYDWLSGSSNLNNAISAMTTANVSIVFIMLGTNDARITGTDPAVYQSHLQGTITALIGAGFSKIVLNYPIYDWEGGGGGSIDAAILSYQANLLALANADPTHVFLGDTDSYTWFLHHPEELQSDSLHENYAGAVSLGYLWLQAYQRLFSTSSNPGTISSFVSVQ